MIILLSPVNLTVHLEIYGSISNSVVGSLVISDVIQANFLVLGTACPTQMVSKEGEENKFQHF